MRKSLLVLAIGMALTSSAFALTVDDSNSPYETDISAGSGGLKVTDAGKVINNSIYIGDPSTSLNETFENDGQITTGVLDIFATQILHLTDLSLQRKSSYTEEWGTLYMM